MNNSGFNSVKVYKLELEVVDSIATFDCLTSRSTVICLGLNQLLVYIPKSPLYCLHNCIRNIPDVIIINVLFYFL